MATQLITPDPHIACKPGYCLEYVRKTYALPARYGSATEAWNNSPSKHRDYNFPAGMYVPLWFAIDIEPNGHIALLCPDGSVYSSSDMTNVPHHHPSIADLIWYYARWGKMTLTFLGWSEDVAGFPVVALDAINFQSSTDIEEYEVVKDEDIQKIARATADIIYPAMTIQNDQFHSVTRSHVIEELAQKIEDTGYQVKVFAQASDNFNGDRIINEGRAGNAALAASMAAAMAGQGASVEDIQKAIIEALNHGVDVNVTVAAGTPAS